MKKNIAVIGCGYWGKNLLRNFYNLGGLSSICDSDIEIINKYSKFYNVKGLSFSEILNNKNIKGVVLAVPAHLHASMSIEALNAGKRVFVEKPLAMNVMEAKLMIAASKKKDVQLMVGHLLQFHPVFKKIRYYVNKGIIGNLKYIFSNRLSFGTVRCKEDVIWSFAPHDISMILSLAGQIPVSVSTKSLSILQKNIADTATIHFEFATGLKSQISVSWLHPYKEHKLTIIGSEAMIVFDDSKPWNKKLALYPYEVSFSQKTIDLTKLDFSYVEVPEEEPLQNECQHFMDVVNKNIKPLTDGDEGLRVLRVLSAASKSQNENKVVKIL